MYKIVVCKARLTERVSLSIYNICIDILAAIKRSCNVLIIIHKMIKIKIEVVEVSHHTSTIKYHLIVFIRTSSRHCYFRKRGNPEEDRERGKHQLSI